MRIIKEADFRKEIKTEPATGYLFYGEEDYLKSFALRTAREAVCADPTFAVFNEMKLEAIDFTPQKLLDAFMPMPMMADKKLIVVSGLDFNAIKGAELEELCDVLAELPNYDYNVLIFSVASDCFDPGYLPKKPSVMMKALSEHLTMVNFERSTPAKLAAWAQKHFSHNGVEVTPQFCARMIEYCGKDMFVLSNEIDKLSFYVRSNGRASVTEEDLVSVCVSATEYDAFAFTNAIMANQRNVALDILADYRFRRIDPILILGDVIGVICNMINVRAMMNEGATTAEISSLLTLHEYKVGLYQKSLRNASTERLTRALEACVEADASLKLSPKGYTPLERLICTL